MAKSRYAIEMDFRRAKAQADALDNLANELNNLANKDYENTITQIQANWESDNATIYFGKAQTVKERMNRSASDLGKAADTIRQIAKNIYDAEMAALALAEARSY